MTPDLDAIPTPAGLAAVADDDLRDALADANLPTLLATLAHLTGDDHWIVEPYRPTPPPDLGDHDGGGFDDAMQDRIRAEAFDVLRAWGRGELDAAPAPDPARLVRILSATLGTRIPDEYGELMGQELGVYSREVSTERPADPERHRVAIIGAGSSGLCLAAHLQRAGIPYVVLDKNPDVGGTWHENVYPGCGVDTPSSLYSLSFAQNPRWSRYFVHRDELAQYWRDVADDFDIRPHMRLGVRVDRAVYDEERADWTLHLTTPDGTREELRAWVVVSAVGLLNQPSTPEIAGIESFEGPVVHTAQWDPSIDLTGRRVAVIGNGASAMQFVPASARVAEHVTAFQRSAQWAMWHPNQPREVPAGIQLLNEVVPHYMGWYRIRVFWRFGDPLHRLLQIDPEFPHPDRAINAANDKLRAMLTQYIEHQLEGRPDLIEQSIPSYPPYGKRLLIDHGWYRAIRRDNVSLVTDGIESVTPTGIRTADGRDHDVDLIVFATGFNAVNVLGSVDVQGRGGQSLRELWGEDDGRAYLGMAVPGFPNFFCLYGPNTNTGHGGTVIAGTEIQVHHVASTLTRMIDEDLASVECRSEAFVAYDTELASALDRTIWTHPGMTTYYRNSQGRIVTNSPWKYIDYWSRAYEPDPAAYDVTPRHAPVAAAEPESR